LSDTLTYKSYYLFGYGTTPTDQLEFDFSDPSVTAPSYSYYAFVKIGLALEPYNANYKETESMKPSNLYVF